MLTVLVVVTAIWLVAAPGILSFGASATVTSIVAGVIAMGAWLVHRIGNAGDAPSGVVAFMGVCLIVAGILLGGVARPSCMTAGTVLIVAGFLAAQQVHREADAAASERERAA